VILPKREVIRTIQTGEVSPFYLFSAGKIMASTMLNRMKETVDNILGQNRLDFVEDAHVVSKFSLNPKLLKT